MVSPELLRRYPFFGGLSLDQIVALAKVAEEAEVGPGDQFFREGEALDACYLVLTGQVALELSLPTPGSRAVQHDLATRTRSVVVATVGPGDLFAWSALVPPYRATATARATGACRVVRFDCVPLREQFQHDPAFGYAMITRIAQVVRDRLEYMHNESLVQLAP